MSGNDRLTEFIDLTDPHTSRGISVSQDDRDPRAGQNINVMEQARRRRRNQGSINNIEQVDNAGGVMAVEAGLQDTKVRGFGETFLDAAAVTVFSAIVMAIIFAHLQ